MKENKSKMERREAEEAKNMPLRALAKCLEGLGVPYEEAPTWAVAFRLGVAFADAYPGEAAVFLGHSRSHNGHDPCCEECLSIIADLFSESPTDDPAL